MVIGAALARGVAVAACLSACWTSCASPQSAGGKNADCFRIEDCQEGLACIPVDPKNPEQKKCSTNLKAVEGTAPKGGGQGGAGGAMARDGAPDAAGDGAPAGGKPGGDAASGNGGSQATGGAPAGGSPSDAGTG